MRTRSNFRYFMIGVLAVIAGILGHNYLDAAGRGIDGSFEPKTIEEVEQ